VQLVGTLSADDKTVDRVTRAHYEQQLKLYFYEKKWGEFQNFFSELMGLRYPSDYVPVRPWGKLGDMKNDGYLKSKRLLFQLYAPIVISDATAIKKIDEDFLGAYAHWEKYFDSWFFVHNGMSGLGPHILKKLLDLELAHPPVKLGQWGFHEIRKEVFELSDPDLAFLLGEAPSDQTMMRVRHSDLEIVLRHIALKPPTLDQDLRPVPADKISANALSEGVATLLGAGMKRADLVGEFFARYYDPGFGEKVAQAFRAQYSTLKKGGMLPDEIFTELLVFAGGAERGSATHEAAVYAVLAHLFETCDIFERPLVGATVPL
jgi:hypothetical protein